LSAEWATDVSASGPGDGAGVCGALGGEGALHLGEQGKNPEQQTVPRSSLTPVA
jgi:hypothetical protein